MAKIRAVHEIIEEEVPYYKEKGGPESKHVLIYESFAETLEPVYYFLLDLMGDFYPKLEKLADTFAPSAGSPNWQEMGQRKGIAQQQASKLMGDINTVLRSVLNLIYDLKDFRIRLQSYKDLKSKNSVTSDAARLSLKQIWMDKVDMSRGNSSIKGMGLGQAGFGTLIDAFLIIKDASLKGPDGHELDLNERVKRILRPRIQEFNMWLEHSESELQKRYDLERTYLRSQVNSLKLYSKWVKPYLKSAQELESKEMTTDPSLVKAFNRMILELTLFGANELQVKQSAIEGRLPKEFANENFLKKALKKKYYSCSLVDFRFLAIPQQGSMIGRSTITFRSYALTEDEIKKIKYELNKSDLGDVLTLIEGATSESLDTLKDDIEDFLEEKKEKEEDKEKDGSNPFLALVGYYNKPKKKDEKKEKDDGKLKDIDLKKIKDTWIEETHFRPAVSGAAKAITFKLYDIYKKAHGMASFDIWPN